MKSAHADVIAQRLWRTLQREGRTNAPQTETTRKRYLVCAWNPRRQTHRQTLKTYDDKVAQEQCAHLEARLWKRDTYGEGAIRTFEEAAVSYLEAGGDKRFVMSIATYFKGRLVGQIKPGDIKEAARLLYPQAKPATQNRQGITPAQAIINHASQLGWCQPIKVVRFKVEKVKRVFVHAEWLNAYMQEANASGHPHLSALALFMFQTGRPIGNALRLTWDDIDLSARTVFVGRPKTGIPIKTIRLSKQMVVALANLPRCQHVFKYSSRNSVYPTMRRICDRAGCTYRHISQADIRSAHTQSTLTSTLNL